MSEGPRLTVLGIDPGRKMGAAVCIDGEVVRSFAIDFGASGAVPWRLVEGFLEDWTMSYHPNLVVYERSGLANGLQAAHVAGGFYAMVELTAQSFGIPFLAVRTSEWRTHAGIPTAAPKSAVLAAARKKWGKESVKTSDEADARFIAEYGWWRLAQSKRGGAK